MTNQQRVEMMARARALAQTEGCGCCGGDIRQGAGAKIYCSERGEGTAITVALCAACNARLLADGTLQKLLDEKGAP